MHRRSLLILAIALLITLAPAYGAFLNNDIGGTTELVDFNQFSSITQLDGNPVQTFQNGAFTISMNVPNFDSSSGTVVSGFGGPTNYLLVNQTQPGDSAIQAVEFTLSGGTVSSIGIRLSSLTDNPHTAIILEIFDASDVVIESQTFASWGGFSGTSPLNSAPGDATGGFYGFSSISANIARFRITGGTITLDDLRFGGLETGGPGPDPSEIPEASTFLLCASILGLLSLGGRIRRLRQMLGR
ncbi:MAG: hypothetical protein U5J83_15530 [Bryobacterales bacterium]|nr:hypothetical protein [Bryobacterales bacterium]